MEGKVTYLKTLSQLETDKIFKVIVEQNDIYIGIAKSVTEAPPIFVSRAQITASAFKKVRSTT
jgi:hypothetical protein